MFIDSSSPHDGMQVRKWTAQPFSLCCSVDKRIPVYISMKHISHNFLNPFQLKEIGLSDTRFDSVPKTRSRAVEPRDNGAFILPLKQCFMKNRRIMHSTARLIALVSGWAGQGAPIETTQGILAKHMSMSVRQIQRMLNDAIREGYLRMAYTKNRMGMITGIILYLRFERIRKPNNIKIRRNLGTTMASYTNGNNSIYKEDNVLENRLMQLAHSMGIKYASG